MAGFFLVPRIVRSALRHTIGAAEEEEVTNVGTGVLSREDSVDAASNYKLQTCYSVQLFSYRVTVKCGRSSHIFSTVLLFFGLSEHNICFCNVTKRAPDDHIWCVFCQQSSKNLAKLQILTVGDLASVLVVLSVL